MEPPPAERGTNDARRPYWPEDETGVAIRNDRVCEGGRVPSHPGQTTPLGHKAAACPRSDGVLDKGTLNSFGKNVTELDIGGICRDEFQLQFFCGPDRKRTTNTTKPGQSVQAPKYSRNQPCRS